MDEEKEKTLEQRAAELNRKALDALHDSGRLLTRGKGSRLFRMDDAPVRCPLCLERFEKMYDGARRIFCYVCHKCRIGIACDDPFVGRWGEALEKAGKIECPMCNADMRFFATSTGFMKATCPKKKCGATVRSVSPDRQAGEVQFLDAKTGAEIDRPSSTPDNLTPGQAGTA